jgi:hypothetical protein
VLVTFFSRSFLHSLFGAAFTDSLLVYLVSTNRLVVYHHHHLFMFSSGWIIL